MNFRDLTGAKFGRLTAVEYVGKRKWKCLCECGQYTVTSGSYLTTGATKSCGCFRRETAKKYHGTHGLSSTPEYEAWQSMLARCYNPNIRGYHRYGGRGIKICDEWRQSFERFYSDVGPRPGPKYSLDRFPNNDGDYEPGNVRWATPQQQARNHRRNRLIEFAGETYIMTDLAEMVGIPPGTFHFRLMAGWPIRKIILSPVRRRQ